MAVNIVFIIYSLIFSKWDVLEPWENYNYIIQSYLKKKSLTKYLKCYTFSTNAYKLKKYKKYFLKCF